jgi:hypothetical protein
MPHWQQYLMTDTLPPITEVSLEASLEQVQGLPWSLISLAPMTPPQSGQINPVDIAHPVSARLSLHRQARIQIAGYIQTSLILGRVL